MKTTLFSVAVACIACAASADTYTNMFTGVKSVDANGVPAAEFASWTTNDVSLANSGGKVEFETDEILKLDITAGPADTNTVVRVAVCGTIEDVGDELLELTAAAQTALAICTNSFNAWNGSSWVALDEVPAGFDGSVPTNLVVEINYQGVGAARWASFKVGDTVLTVRTNDSERVYLATAANNLSGFGVNGCGTLASADGEVMLGVAEYAGVKYGTLSNAVAVASAAADPGASPVEVLRPTSENVTIDTEGVVIADNGKTSGVIDAGDTPVAVQPSVAELIKTDEGVGGGASGSYSIPVKITGSNLQIKLPMSNKEIVDGSIVQLENAVTFTIQTKASVITNAAPGGKALSASESKLRTFLAANAKTTYEAADVTSESIASALAADGDNGIPLYQSYALGITPTTSVKPVAAAPGDDKIEGKITLKIPSLVGTQTSGDYTPSFKVYKNGNEEQVPVSPNTAGAIAVPLETGSYTVKIVLQ